MRLLLLFTTILLSHILLTDHPVDQHQSARGIYDKGQCDSLCNTLNIPQDSLSFCSLTDTLNIIFIKNEECGADAVFHYDSSLYSLVSQTSIVSTFVARKPGGSYIYAIINADCGEIKDSVYISYTSSDVTDISKTEIINGRLKNVLTAPKGFVSYVWDNGNEDDTLEVDKSGEYSVKFTDLCGNEFSDTIIVTRPSGVKFPAQGLASNMMVSYPSGFSPNGDGKNDRFRPILKTSIQSYQLSVYDQYGKILFVTRDVNKEWDGTSNGKPMITGSYVWKCSYVTGSSAKSEKGVVVLIR